MSKDIIGVLDSQTQFSFDDLGEGAVPIVFIHGFPFDKTMWELQMNHFKASHRVIAYDIRGFGKSFDDTHELSIELFADDLIGLLDSLHIPKAILCGLSMGGFIALNVINRFPDRVEALILCDTQCISDPEEVKAARYNTISQIIKLGKGEFTEDFIGKLFYQDSYETKKDKVELIRSIIRSNSQHAITRGLAALAERAETCSTLSLITAPTLVLCGHRDLITPIAQSELLHRQIKNSTMQVIEDAGHVSNLEQPEVFNNHIADFLEAYQL